MERGEDGMREKKKKLNWNWKNADESTYFFEPNLAYVITAGGMKWMIFFFIVSLVFCVQTFSFVFTHIKSFD